MSTAVRRASTRMLAPNVGLDVGRRSINLLSAREIATLKAPGRYSDGGGLYLHIDETGLKRWVLRYQFRGRRRDMGLGPVETGNGLSEARAEREAAKILIRDGKDPIDERRRPAPSDTPTFGEMVERVIAEKEKAFKTAKQGVKWRQDMKRHAGRLYARPVDQITTEDVLAVLKPIWATKSDTASRIRGRIEDVLSAARAAAHRSGENPAAWRGHLSHLLPPRKRLAHGHRAAMPYRDVPAFLERLGAKGGNGALALRFTILTAVRENEALGALIGEIDREARVWTIPGGPKGRMKGSNPPPHRVPLPAAAMEIIEGRLLFGDDPHKLLFPGTKGRQMSNAAMDRVIRDMGVTGATVHGFRSSFKDWASDCTAFPDSLSEEALAHKVGDDVRQSYRRSDALEKRRKLMEAWARYLTTPKGEVVPMSRNVGKSRN